MKNMRRIFSMLLVMVMIVTFALPGMTAKAAVDTYEVYQIFTGNKVGAEFSNAKWGKNAIEATGTDVADTVINELKAVNDSSDQEKLAVILKYVNLDSASAYKKTANSGEQVTIEGVTPGYYLIKLKSGSQEAGEAYGLYVAQVTNGTLNFSPKVSAPTVEKDVNKDNANIGDTITFALKATMSDHLSDFETYKLKFTDTMSKGLTLVEDSIKVMVGTTDITSYFAKDISTDANGTHISVACVDIRSITNPVISNGAEIIVTYEATLNENAKIGAEGNDNKVILEYSNNPNITKDDLDGDGIPNDEDDDIDGDGIPNDKDDDIDGDGIPNDEDPDDDGDGIPDILDPDADSDGDDTPNGEEPEWQDKWGEDEDGDGVPDILDPESDDYSGDSDGDGIPDAIDPDNSNPNGDDDNDGILNKDDPDHPAYDEDGDGIPDIKDPDDDDDGIKDADDPDDKFDGKDTSDTPEDKEIVTTGAIKVIKTKEDKSPLQGVKFVLLDKTNKKIAKVNTTTGTIESWDNYTEGSYNGYELTTDANGEINIKGVADGTYYLKETLALDGYNKLKEDVPVTVSDAQTTVVPVVNYQGTALPETGGIGTTIFYVLGGLMVAGAAVLLVTKKRMGNE